MALAVGFVAWILPGKSNKDSAAVLPATMSTTFDADTSEDQRQAGSRIERKNVVNRATEKIEGDWRGRVAGARPRHNRRVVAHHACQRLVSHGSRRASWRMRRVYPDAGDAYSSE